MSELGDGLIGVIHSHSDSTAWVVEDVVGLLGSSVLWGEDDLEGSWLVDDEVGGSVLVTESVSSDDDGLLPLRDQKWDVLAEDGFSEHGSVEVVSDGSVGGFP